ncbi:MAG: fructose-bisphosphate aldolase [Planctomycetes bacterium]|nr:fructose-bisphosphate aldolase [Planctomycetota bacterium]
MNTESGRVVIVPVDDGLISLSKGLRNLRTKLEQLVSGKPDAILGFPGVFAHHQDLLGDVPQILNLTASTAHVDHTRKVLVGSVRQALKLDVDAVAVHVNITSKHESQMLKTLGKVARQCDDTGMPLVAIMYPRSESTDGDNNYIDLRKTDSGKFADLVAHCARIGVELGASIVKTQYTGNAETFARVVEACSPVPVVVAGGPFTATRHILQVTHDVVSAGGAGVSFGRNVFDRPDARLLEAVKSLVHDMKSVEEVIEMYFGDELSDKVENVNATDK